MKTIDPKDYYLVPKRAIRQTLGAALLSLAAALAAAPAWLPLLAHALIVNEPLQPADAIVVLGGGSGDREQTGARLYDQGLAPVVVVMGDVVLLPGMPDTTFASLSAAELERLGVPSSAIVQLPDSASTCDDARLTLAQLPPTAKRLLLVTDPFHTRRAEWLFLKGADGVDIVTVAANPSWFDPDHWWQRENGIIVVAQEYVKFAMTLIAGCS